MFCVCLVLAGCATRPVNPRIENADSAIGYRLTAHHPKFKEQQNLVILAFSGGGTRAAAFSYGVLEYLHSTEVIGPKGNKTRLLDHVDLITGVSGGSFTALAYGLYGERLFDEYETRFLKRNVQGEIIARTFSPSYWGNLWSRGWGRSELAADLYDEILFDDATYGDLRRKEGPFVLVSATDISTGGRFGFSQLTFDIMCSNLDDVRLSRAAAASSAVPVVLSSLTFNNYGGTCGFVAPDWTRLFLDSEKPPRPAARALRSMRTMETYGDGKERPFIHLVDGGVSDNVAMRGVLESLELMEALHYIGEPTPLDNVHRIIVFVVNSLSSPPTSWDKSEKPPGMIELMLRSAGVPIDHFSYESIELLKDIGARWNTMKLIRNSPAIANSGDPRLTAAVRGPDIEIYAIDVSFAALRESYPAEFAYLNEQPTSFVLPPEAVDRLRAAAGKIIADSPDFKRLLKDVGATIVPPAVPPVQAAGKLGH
ncbi:MAG: patatin-like phospholipase family protein [Betaproteobacteria bacterium]|nr:patatin-like phospholipase family protein [Betaproteobacteria bacterium]